MIKTYGYTDNTQISPHFNAQEFRCKCGMEHDFQIDDDLISKLEALYAALNCSKIIVTSGFRCAAHDKAVKGSGTGQHTLGNAADICCYGQDGQPISSKVVCCKAQDIGFRGIANITAAYEGKVSKDGYGRVIPYHAHGTGNLEQWSSSTKDIAECMMRLYDCIINPELLVRRINICACHLIYENQIPEDDGPVQLELFVDYEEEERKKAEKKRKEERERALQRATLQLQGRFGKNAVLKGMNLIEGGTTIERNGQIGGHIAEASEVKKDDKGHKKQ